MELKLMGRFLFYLFLILIVLFLVFFWNDGWESFKKTKSFKQTQQKACQAKSVYKRSEKWIKMHTQL